METQGQLRQLRQLSKYLIKFLYCYVQQIADNVLVQNLNVLVVHRISYKG